MAGSVAPGVLGVAGFVEKPDQANADVLHRGGALWNTFILGAPVRTFDRIVADHLPIHAARFAALANRRADVDNTFHDLPPADFSRSVLQRAHDLSWSR